MLDQTLVLPAEITSSWSSRNTTPWGHQKKTKFFITAPANIWPRLLTPRSLVPVRNEVTKRSFCSSSQKNINTTNDGDHDAISTTKASIYSSDIHTKELYFILIERTVVVVMS